MIFTRVTVVQFRKGKHGLTRGVDATLKNL